MDGLIGIYKNLKKSPNRDYTENYKVSTLRTIEELKSIALKSEGYSLEDIEEIERKIFSYLKLKEIKDMASFGILDASKIIPEFNGDLGQMSNFLGIIEFYAETLKDSTEVSKLIKFVLATKLTDKVRNKLISEETPNSLETFKRTLRKVFTPKKSLSSVHTELSKQTQGNGSVTQFANKVESLIAILNELQVTELGSQSRELIIKMNDQVALSTFKNGLNEPHRTTVLAARPKSLNEAVHIASEVVSQPNSIMHFNKNRRFFDNRRFRGNNSGRNNSSNINTYNRDGNNNPRNNLRRNSNNYNNNSQRDGNFPRNNSNYNNNSQRDGNFPRNNSNYNNNSQRDGNFRNRNQRRVYVAQEQGNEISPYNPQE